MNKMNILKSGTIINGQQVVEIIKKHGGALLSVDGSMPIELTGQDLIDIADMEGFVTSINYGCSVHFNWEGEGMRAWIIVDGLKGQCGELIENDILQPAQWFAEA